MKLLSLLLGFCLVAPGLHAYALHPTVLTVQYKDQMLPVVKVVGTDPVVMVDGKEKRIRDYPYYLPQGAAGYADNSIDAPEDAFGGRYHITSLNGSGGGAFQRIYFDGMLTAKKTIRSRFIVVIIYSFGNPYQLPTYLDHPTVIVHALPDLPAGEAVRVKFSKDLGAEGFGTDYCIQIFDGTGREVVTPGLGYASQFYAMCDFAHLTRAMEKYLAKFKGADHDALPAIMPKPIFKNGAILPKGEVSALLTIATTGQVSGVEVQGVEDAAVRKCVAEALGGWLFLPKLKAGQPVPSKISVPLQF